MITAERAILCIPAEDLIHSNAGAGQWVDLSGVYDHCDLYEVLEAAFEDWEEQSLVVMEYKGMSSFGRRPNLDALGRYLCLCEETDPDVVKLVTDHVGVEYMGQIEDIIDQGVEKWSSLAEFAHEHLNGAEQLHCLDENLKMYFDYEAYGRDLQMGGDITAIEDRDQGGFHIWWTV